ncbi:serine/threonine-protein kinase ULK3-like [Orbicella faveolata]|uniref:serine/threonine-protein kinase ULK3-like n=1 Tax=Orbicella faveolata TaxID=48498 RepID=UPI0009E3E3A7|nr:serine/threonine-protein kinase ULK3-like [Orbicella faveolata]
MAASADLRVVPPPRLEHYVMTEKLGQGTYATVYKAFKKGDTRDVVAIKCIQKSSLSKTATENLLTEIELLKKLDHEHIVKLKDFEWNDQYIFLIMEYCSGGDLSRFIHSRRVLPEDIARRFLRQLALALHFLHANNIAHMDLKPQNLLLSARQNPVLKLADFGFAQYLHSEEETQTIRGSPLYMAPEMICSMKYDARVDLWSVGVILYEALFGIAPFASGSFAELEKKIRSSDPITLPVGSKVSPDCQDLLLALLQRDPLARISFEEFFAHPFLDLEHVPSPLCLEKAIKLVTEAIKMDDASELKEAAKLYCEAMAFFLPAIEYEKDPQMKTRLRERVNQYMSRAEELKQCFKIKSHSNPDELLARYSKDHAELKAALHLANIAEIRDEHGAYDSALSQYQVALEALLPILSGTPRGPYKDAVHLEVSKYMRRAEEIKLYLKLSKENMKVVPEAGGEDQSRCVIQ